MKNWWIIAAFAVVLIGPLALRSKTSRTEKADLKLIIVTPHNEATRYEFSRAFDEYYFRKHGQHVEIDWRTPGGTSEISRYLESQYTASFQNYWTNELHRQWDAKVQGAFANAKAPTDNSPEAQARKAFLDSDVGCGLDLFFGGGSFDFILQANAGRLVDSGIIAKHPEVFNSKVIPQSLGGEPYWDTKGRWVGACLASFGICYNTDVLRVLKIDKPPAQWDDLADPRYFGQLALGNPNQSGSVAKAFEMLIQQQMGRKPKFKMIRFSERHMTDGNGADMDVSEVELQDIETGWRGICKLKDLKGLQTDEKNIQKVWDLITVDQLPESFVLKAGWGSAMLLIQRISANARYFTDSGTKVPFDVLAGDAAAGMCIDFYGRFESEAARKADGTSRMQYITPTGGSSVGCDPIGLFRGAPHGDLAKEFIEFVVSLEGQKLWDWKIGAQGGPGKYALRRLPIRPELYAQEYAADRSDPDVQPYEQASAFQYHDQWTSPLFRVISFVIRVMCIDTHDELRDAQQALIAAHFPPQATAAFEDVSKVDYAAASGPIRDTLRSSNKIDELKLAKTLAESFREQYRKAAELAREGK